MASAPVSARQKIDRSSCPFGVFVEVSRLRSAKSGRSHSIGCGSPSNRREPWRGTRPPIGGGEESRETVPQPSSDRMLLVLAPAGPVGGASLLVFVFLVPARTSLAGDRGYDPIGEVHCRLAGVSGLFQHGFGRLTGHRRRSRTRGERRVDHRAGELGRGLGGGADA